MSIDLYTRAVLSIIAGCLLVIVCKLVLAPQPAVAQQCSSVVVENNGLKAVPVRIVGIEQYDGYYRKSFEDGSTGKRRHLEPWNPLPVVQK